VEAKELKADTAEIEADAKAAEEADAKAADTAAKE